MQCRDDNDKPLTLAHQALEFELDDFTYHVELALAAGSLKIPIANPELQRVGIVSDEGDYVIHFTDQPMNRAMFAVKASFNDS